MEMATYMIDNIPEPIDFEIDNDEERRAVQNAKNLLMTRMGEIPYDRQRGFNHNLYGLPLSDLQGALMAELDRVMLWEPTVEVVSANILRLDEDRVVISVEIDVDLTKFG